MPPTRSSLRGGSSTSGSSTARASRAGGRSIPAKRLPELGATRILLHDPAGVLQPHRAGELVAELRELSGLPVGLYSQGAGRNALSSALEAVRAGADLIACAVYPVALAGHRISAESAAEALAGIGYDPGVDLDVLWEAADLVDEHIGDTPVAPLVPRIAARAARRKLPVAIVSAVDAQLRARGAGGRLDEVLDELDTRAPGGGLAAARGADRPDHRVAGARQRPRREPLRDDRRRAARPRARALRPHARPDRPGARAGGRPARRRARSTRLRSTSTRCGRRRRALLRATRSCCCSRCSASEAEPLLRSIRERVSGDESLASGVDQAREERIREVVRIVEESEIDEITVEEDGMRVRVRRTADAPAGTVPGQHRIAATGTPELPARAPAHGILRIESPMVGTFYRGRPAGVAAVRRGGRRRRRRPDALHPRGDEADERGQVRDRGHRR